MPAANPTESAIRKGARRLRAAGTLSALTEVQGVPLVVPDGELCRSPGGLVRVLHEEDALLLERVGRSPGIVRFKIEVKVLAPVYNPDRGVLLVRELQVED